MPRLERAFVTLVGAAKALLKTLDGGGAWVDITAARSAAEQAAPRGDVLSGVAVWRSRCHHSLP